MEQLEVIPVRIRVAAIVRNAILSREFAPGQELSLTDTAARLGVSRTPVREAFQTLEAEGLLTLRMNKGAVVKLIDSGFIRDHFRIRRLLEGEAVERAIENGLEAGVLRELHAAVIQAGGAANKAEYERYNQEFHAAIWRAARGPKLVSFLQSLWNGPSYGSDDMKHRELALAEHNELIECIARGDAEAGRRVMYRHIERSMENILQAAGGVL